MATTSPEDLGRAAGPREAARRAIWAVYGRVQAALRAERDWSQAELARRAGVSGGLVAGYELGEKRHPAYEELARVAAALGHGLDPLMAKVYEEAGVSLLEGVVAPGAAPARRDAADAGDSMNIARVQTRGQVTVPQEIREACGVVPGADLLFVQRGPDSFECRVLPARRTLAEVTARYAADGVAPDLSRLREEMGAALACERLPDQPHA